MQYMLSTCSTCSTCTSAGPVQDTMRLLHSANLTRYLGAARFDGVFGRVVYIAVCSCRMCSWVASRAWHFLVEPLHHGCRWMHKYKYDRYVCMRVSESQICVQCALMDHTYIPAHLGCRYRESASQVLACCRLCCIYKCTDCLSLEADAHHLRQMHCLAGWHVALGGVMCDMKCDVTDV